MDYCQPHFTRRQPAPARRGVNRQGRDGLRTDNGDPHLCGQSRLLAELPARALAWKHPRGEGWLAQLPHKYHQRATCMFDRHGLLALLAGRFLAFVRTLLPTMAGISGLPNRRFQFFNWLSALLWVGVVTTLGYALNMIPLLSTMKTGDDLPDDPADFPAGCRAGGYHCGGD